MLPIFWWMSSFRHACKNNNTPTTEITPFLVWASQCPSLVATLWEVGDRRRDSGDGVDRLHAKKRDATLFSFPTFQFLPRSRVYVAPINLGRLNEERLQGDKANGLWHCHVLITLTLKSFFLWTVVFWNLVQISHWLEQNPKLLPLMIMLFKFMGSSLKCIYCDSSSPSTSFAYLDSLPTQQIFVIFNIWNEMSVEMAASLI